MTNKPPSVTLTEKERNFVFSLVETVTGTCQRGSFRRDVLASNVERRVRNVGAQSLKAYLEFALHDPVEGDLFISALTIHTTSWFRELTHFEKLEEDLREKLTAAPGISISILCAGCSSGEEVYSLAFVLEKLRGEFPGFEYHVHGFDIDPVSIQHANRGVYGTVAFSHIPDSYRRFCLVGYDSMEGFFAPNSEIRSRCSFEILDIRCIELEGKGGYDHIFCRNLLIYFGPEDVANVVRSLLATLKPYGLLFLGHSESCEASNFGVQFVGESTYIKTKGRSDKAVTHGPVCRVLIVDDSTVARKAIEKSLAKGGLVSHSVSSAQEASDFLEKQSVDIITLDVTMPGLDGPTWLNSRRLAGLGVPVVIVSESGPSRALSILGALENGAQDYIEKSSISSDDFPAKLLAIHKSYRPRLSPQQVVRRCALQRTSVPRERPDLILIGASTGGTEAVMRLLQAMPPDSPPILIVQHISAHFAHPFAARVAQNAGLKLGICTDGSLLEPGHVYVADNARHLGVCGKRGRLSVLRSDGPPINRHRPSVDFLFQSAAVLSNVRISAVLLTGMGADGALGMKQLHEKGHITFAQDEQSCVVFGMPREAVGLGAVDIIASPLEIRQHLDWQISGAPREPGPGRLRISKGKSVKSEASTPLSS